MHVIKLATVHWLRPLVYAYVNVSKPPLEFTPTQSIPSERPWPQPSCHLGVESTQAELQAANHASLRVCAGVARIAQDEDVARHGVKHRLQRGSGVGAANDGGVRCLALFHQGLPHGWSDPAGNGSTHLGCKRPLGTKLAADYPWVFSGEPPPRK